MGFADTDHRDGFGGSEASDHVFSPHPRIDQNTHGIGFVESKNMSNEINPRRHHQCGSHAWLDTGPAEFGSNPIRPFF